MLNVIPTHVSVKYRLTAPIILVYRTFISWWWHIAMWDGGNKLHLS